MHRRRIIAVAFACVVGSLRWATADTTIVEPSQVIDVDEQARSLTSKPPVITSVAIVPGGGQIVTAGDDHLVRVWSTSTGRIVQTLRGHHDWVRTLAVSPDGQALASAGDDRQIMLWELATGKPLRRSPAHPQAIYSLAYNPQGTLLAAVGFDHMVRVYDARTGAISHEIDGPGRDLRSVVFSADGAQMAAAGRSGQIRVWAMPSAKVTLEIAAGPGRIRTLAYLPNGETIVAASEGRAISMWSASSGAAVYKFNCPTAKVLSMAVCGEHLIATGGSDNAVRIWNWQTQTEVDRLLGHTGSVAALAYDPASGVLLSGSYDTTVRVWKLNSEGSKDTARESEADAQVR